jgi:acid phosphatase
VTPYLKRDGTRKTRVYGQTIHGLYTARPSIYPSISAMRSTLFSVFFSIFWACADSADEVPGRAFNRFITIWLENQVGLLLFPGTPFLLKLSSQDYLNVSVNSAVTDLAKQGILLTEYFGLSHPSQPNYIASISGDSFGLNNDNFVRIPENVSTVVDLFDTKGITWSGYFEGLPGPGYMGAGSTGLDGGWDYVRKHK